MSAAGCTKALYDGLRRHGVEGEEAFLALASRYLDAHRTQLSKLKHFPVERACSAFTKVAHDRQAKSLLSEILHADPVGRDLPNWYQFFLGRRFREGSGKFFTPRTVAQAMSRLLPVRPGATIMDPTCGGGTFLTEASHGWRGLPCQLIGNDVDKMLVGLTELVLSLSIPSRHTLDLRCRNIFDASDDFEDLYGTVDAILANPPFSLPVDGVGKSSNLFALGYRNSDAVFLDICLNLMAPEGNLVCLLPHSLVANVEFQELRETVEKNWALIGAVTLPEGVFYMTGNTSTRADIVHLRKLGARKKKRKQTYFANAPAVGYALNSRSGSAGDNSLDLIVNDVRVQECVDEAR
jgi:N-6 DNA Methylase